MIRLFRWFRRVPMMDKVIGIWAEADGLLAEVTHSAGRLHAQVTSGSDAATVGVTLEQVLALDERLGRLEVAFSEALGDASRTMQRLLGTAIVAIAVVLVAISTAFVRGLTRQAAYFEDALRASDERFRRAVLSSPDGFWDWNLTTGEVYISPRFETLLGYEPGTLSHSLESLKSLLHPDDRARARAALSAHARRGELYDVELRLRTADGSERWMRSRAQKSFEPTQKISQITGSISDITERRRAEEELREAKDKLEERVAERTQALTEANARLLELDHLKSEFLATMSHELRTPLNAVLGFTTLLLDQRAGPLTDKQRQHLVLASKAGEHLLSLINDVLDVSRIESGRMDVDHATFDFTEVISEIESTVRPMAEAKHLKLVCETRGQDLVVRGDKRKCFQVLLNLADNAVKFTEQGEVRVVAGTTDDLLWFEVSDTGIGIAPGDLPLLFERFRQIDGGSRRRQEGSGLGLYLCRKLAELMGGTIRVESTLGVGSTFRLTLPRGRKAVNADAVVTPGSS
jgi:PAS domain S-box-containing protein